MGKAKAKGKTKQRARRRREVAAARDASEPVGDLPRLDTLKDVPSFADLKSDERQRAAFRSYVEEAAASDPVSAEELRMGFVVRLDRGFPLVATEGATFRAEHAVAFAKTRGEEERLLPAVGDAVAVRVPDGHDMGVIECVLPRRTSFARWRGKNRGERQVLAANVDTIFIVQPLGADRSDAPMIDRIARSLVLVNDCGAEPVVVFTKSDRVGSAEVERLRGEAARVVGEGIRIIATSAATGSGLDEVRASIPAGSCAMILGESGAGKSTLLNALLGYEALETGGVRERDDMGRHTTVARVMVALPAPCGVVADAPGLRSLPLVGHERGLARTFPAIVEASRSCRFRDCTHTHEPGCALRDAVTDGSVDEAALNAFLTLADEMRVSAQSLDPDVQV